MPTRNRSLRDEVLRQVREKLTAELGRSLDVRDEDHAEELTDHVLARLALTVGGNPHPRELTIADLDAAVPIADDVVRLHAAVLEPITAAIRRRLRKILERPLDGGDEQLVQSVLFEALERLREKLWTQPGKIHDPTAYGVMIAFRLLSDRFAADRFEEHRLPPEMDPAGREPSHEAAVDSRELEARLWECLQELGVEDRRVLVLRFIRGKELREIRGSPATAHRAIAKALERLRQALRRHGLTHEHFDGTFVFSMLFAKLDAQLEVYDRLIAMPPIDAHEVLAAVVKDLTHHSETGK